MDTSPGTITNNASPDMCPYTGTGMNADISPHISTVISTGTTTGTTSCTSIVINTCTNTNNNCTTFGGRSPCRPELIQELTILL